MGKVKFKVEGGVNSEGNLLPDDNNNEYYIGSSDLKWKGVYIGTDGIIFNDGSVQTAASTGGGGETALYAQDSMPTTSTDGALWLDTDGTLATTSFIEKSVLTTSGDLLYGSSANTPSRIAIGNTGDVLTVSGGAPAWTAGGGMTLLSTTTLSGATTTINSISTSYKSLYAVIYGITSTAAYGIIRIAPNGTTNITDTITSNSGGTTSGWTGYTNGYLQLCSGLGGYAPVYNNSSNSWSLTISNYASTSANKSFFASGGFEDLQFGYRGFLSSGQIKTTSAITSLVFSSSTGNLSSGTVLLYGVN